MSFLAMLPGIIIGSVIGVVIGGMLGRFVDKRRLKKRDSTLIGKCKCAHAHEGIKHDYR